jgi:hypothetical protein
MTREYEERRTGDHRAADDIDREALRFVKSWHRHPDVHDALWYHGVNLGEVDEYMLLPEVIAALIAREESESP